MSNSEDKLTLIVEWLIVIFIIAGIVAFFWAMATLPAR